MMIRNLRLFPFGFGAALLLTMCVCAYVHKQPSERGGRHCVRQHESCGRFCFCASVYTNREVSTTNYCCC